MIDGHRWSAQFLLVCVLALPFTARAGRTPHNTVFPTGDQLRLRSTPSLSGDIIAALSREEPLTLLAVSSFTTDVGGLSDRWYRVKTAAGRRGWAFGGYLGRPVQVINGGFETSENLWEGTYVLGIKTGDTILTGWTIASGDIDHIGDYWSASEGLRSLDLCGYQKGAVAQTIDTIPGRRYTILFALSGEPDSHPPSLKTVRVSAGSTTADFSFDTMGHQDRSHMLWKTVPFVFTASEPRTTLMFSAVDQSAAGPALDDVRVYVDLNAPPETRP